MAALAKNNTGMNIILECLNGHGPMNQVQKEEEIEFRGVKISVEHPIYECTICGLEAGTTEQAGELQLRIADVYRKTKGLLTSEEIKDCRTKLGLTQAQLAEKIEVGIASIKRWETGAIQTPAMDNLLRTALRCEIRPNNPYSGNRDLSLPRIKLVFKKFEERIDRILLKEDDKMLYSAKYLFYADMLAYKYLGISMTGAAYAHLPHGPQLNNYRELIGSIQEANENDADPLSADELNIIYRVADKFPGMWDAFNASHRENVVKRRPVGSMIPYTDAEFLTEVN